MPIGQHTENEFLTTLGHAIRFLELTRISEELGDIQSFSTATTFFCAASVEAAANGLLQLVDVSNKVFDLVDRFPVIEKIDLVANARGKEIDRGAYPVQQMRELIKSRHGIVHPKIVTRAVEFETLPGNEYFAKHHVAKDSVIADGSVERKSAEKAVGTTIAFLNYAVADLLAFSQAEAEHCLVGVGPTDEKRPTYHIDALRILLRYQSQHGNFRFMVLPTIPGESAP